MADLPTGTVTFLFTDIEGSTKLAQGHPAEWEAARLRHHAILREATEAHQGYVFQVIGDAFCVAFPTASHGLQAALAGQRALQAEAWGETPIRVRMGLHTGAADARDGDYHGYLTLAHVQRVMSTAYGGQTLVSNATAALLSGQLPNGVSLRDMGEHRLKGLLNPEQLSQLVAPDLPQDFPPLQSLNTIPNNLPIQVTSFVGRERESGELQRLLTTTRLLTLTGSGGTGKTRLSLQVAAEVLDSFKDGVWFVELAPLADPSLVPVTIASVLGIREELGRPLMATLLDWLRPKRLLFILDNCEHLIDACAKFADAVLHASRETRILASSREAMGIAGELDWRVPSLPAPNPSESLTIVQLEQFAAVQLFIERALFAQPTFKVTNANAPAVAQICYRLDGIPLAIELAAARVKALSVDKIAERLDDRFRLLTGGSRTNLPRQQTLRGTIDWSHNLLSEAERALLRRLSVFAGGGTLEAAEAVCAFPPDVNPLAAPRSAPDASLAQADILDILSHLVDKSLVVLDDQPAEPRYDMLETIRQYAREKLLDANERESFRDRHLAYFLKLAERAEPVLFTAERREWLPRLDLEIDNLRTALEWASERDRGAALWLAGLLRWFWFAGDHLNEGRTWYVRVLALGEWTVLAKQVALARLGAGIVSGQLAFADAYDTLQQSAALWKDLDDKERLAESVHWMAGTLVQSVNAEEACAIYEANESLIRQSATPMVLSIALGCWGRAVANARGDYAAATRLLNESLAVGRKWNDPAPIGVAYMYLGQCALQQRDYESARRYHLEALAWRRRLRFRFAIMNSLMSLAEVACLQGNYVEARPLCDEALALARDTGQQTIAALLFVRLAYLAVHQGDTRQALIHLADSLKIFRAGASPFGIALCVAGYAELLRIQGKAGPATRLLAAIAAVPQFRTNIWPFEHIEYERSMAAVRAELSDAAFDAAWAEGRALTPDRAIDLALKDVDA